MASAHATYKLFPRKWYKDFTSKQLDKARAQLNNYATSKELDTGLSEVSINVLLRLRTQAQSKDVA